MDETVDVGETGRREFEDRVLLAGRRAAAMRFIALMGSLGLVLVAVVLTLPGDSFALSGAAQVGYFASGVSLVVIAVLTPWERLLLRPHGGYYTVAVLLAGVFTVGAIIAFDTGATSPLFWFNLLPVLFTAVSFGGREQVALFVIIGLTYVCAAMLGGNVMAATMAYNLGVLGLVAATAGYLTRLLRDAVVEADAAHHRAEHHASLLGVAADGARRAAASEPEDVLDAVAETVEELGYDIVAVYVDDGDDSPAVHVVRGADLDAATLHESVAALILENGRTLVVEETAAIPHLAAARAQLGVRSVIGTPFHGAGSARPSGVVVAASCSPRTFDAADVEVFELVAAYAGRALDVAHRYTHERDRVRELAQLDQLKSEFLSTASHELRTPLTVILGLSQTLWHNWGRMDEEQRAHLVERIYANAGSLDGVVSSLLDYTRLEQGRLESRAVPFDVALLLRSVATRLQPMLRDHDVSLEVPLAQEVHGDERLIERVIENLLTNTARHTPPGTGVVLRCTRRGDEVHISVADDGPGIREVDRPHLGEPFYRGGDPASRPARGVGVGLALITEVLRLHGRRLEISTEVGVGTTFSFSLPVVAPERDSVTDEPGTHRPSR